MTREMNKIVFLFSMSLYFSRSKINIWVHKIQTRITQCLISNMKFDEVEKEKNVVWNGELFYVDMYFLWGIYKRGCRNLHSLLRMPLARMGETVAIKYMFLIVFNCPKYVFIKTNWIKYFNDQMFWKHCRDVERKKKGGCHMTWYFVLILLTEVEKNHDACALSKYVNILNFTVTAWKLFWSFKFKKVMHMF